MKIMLTLAQFLIVREKTMKIMLTLAQLQIVREKKYENHAHTQMCHHRQQPQDPQLVVAQQVPSFVSCVA